MLCMWCSSNGIWCAVNSSLAGVNYTYAIQWCVGNNSGRLATRKSVEGTNCAGAYHDSDSYPPYLNPMTTIVGSCHTRRSR